MIVNVKLLNGEIIRLGDKINVKKFNDCKHGTWFKTPNNLEDGSQLIIIDAIWDDGVIEGVWSWTYKEEIIDVVDNNKHYIFDAHTSDDKLALLPNYILCQGQLNQNGKRFLFGEKHDKYEVEVHGDELYIHKIGKIKHIKRYIANVYDNCNNKLFELNSVYYSDIKELLLQTHKNTNFLITVILNEKLSEKYWKNYTEIKDALNEDNTILHIKIGDNEYINGAIQIAEYELELNECNITVIKI